MQGPGRRVTTGVQPPDVALQLTSGPCGGDGCCCLHHAHPCAAVWVHACMREGQGGRAVHQLLPLQVGGLRTQVCVCSMYSSWCAS